MKNLITAKEEKICRNMLALSPVPEMTYSFDELRGYLHGIAITPVKIETNEWLPVIFGDSEPAYFSIDQKREMTGTLYTILNKHIAAFQEGRLFLPFDMANLDEEEVESVVAWTFGFGEALALRPECWEEYKILDEEEQELLINSLVIVEGIVYPEDALDMFDHISREEMLDMGVSPRGEGRSKAVQVQYFMLQALELAIETIQQHALGLELKRRQKRRSSVIPLFSPDSRRKMGGLCPCGSGRSMKSCCGSGSTKKAAKKHPGGKAKVVWGRFPGGNSGK